MARTVKLIRALVGLILVASVLPVAARAAEGPLYQEVAWDYGHYHRYGTNGQIYATNRPIVKLHVNGLYIMRQDSQYMAETGITESYVDGWQDGKSYFYRAILENGSYYRDDLGKQLPKNNWYSMTVRNVVKNNTYSSEWRFYLWDGQPLTLGTNYFIWDFDVAWSGGQSLGSGERWATGDSNLGHFKGMQYRTSTGSWYSWDDLRDWGSNDPGYAINKISNTQFYIE